MTYAEDIARTCGAKKTSLGMVYDNKVLLEFYEKQNYKIDKIKKYKDQRLDLVYMKKDLYENL